MNDFVKRLKITDEELKNLKLIGVHAEEIEKVLILLQMRA